jgi:hypothetical protein
MPLDRVPRPLKVSPPPIWVCARNHIAPDSGCIPQEFQGWSIQYNRFPPRFAVGQKQQPATKVDVLPLQAKNFSHPRARKQEQAKCQYDVTGKQCSPIFFRR